ncbi:alanine--glyoxylate aminotransferase family protein [bacterium]|nr:alanine--glyoxylate aminotransferase family protein [bacterium]
MLDNFLELFIPGPTNIDGEIAKYLCKPSIGHRSGQFSEIFAETDKNLKQLLYTQNRIFHLTCAATGAWEAAVLNSVGKGVLHVVNGAFSEKWAKISKICNKNTEILELDWGKAPKPEQIREKLLSGKFDTVAFVHNETSTGAMANLQELSEMLREFPEVLVLVDAVSSMMGTKIEIDKLGIDVCLASLQKAWALPPGYALVSVSEKAMQRSKSLTNKGHYFDFEVYEEFYTKNQTPYTPSLPHLYALLAQSERFLKEGPENRFARHKKMAEITRKWVSDNGFALFSEEGYHSETLTCVKNTREIDVEQTAKILKTKGYLFDKGYGKIKGKTFRIAHMGETDVEKLGKFLFELAKAIG